MLLSFFKNKLNFIFNALIVVGVVVTVFLWNPYGIFGGGTKLQDTANMVDEIRDIGQLVTAEYYGEVISTYEDFNLDINDAALLEDEVGDSYLRIKEKLYDLIYVEIEDLEADDNKTKKKIKKSKDKIIKQVSDGIQTYIEINNLNSDHDPMHLFILYLAKYEWKINVRINKYNKENSPARKAYIKQLKSRGLRKEFDRISAQIMGEEKYEDYSYTGLTNNKSFAEFYSNEISTDNNKDDDDKKVKLAIIGRGSVKAGIDFGSLTEDNLVYDKKLKNIYIFGLKTDVLDCDINPWFIPEKRVPGFDILIANRRAKFIHMKKLKIDCIHKLETKARTAGIVQQAQDNAKEVLKNFFCLVTGDEINNVYFKENILDTESKNILKDNAIRIEELEMIDTIYGKMLVQIRSSDKEEVALKKKYEQQLRTFLAGLDTSLITIDSNNIIPFNYYNRKIPYICRDPFLEKTELDIIKKNKHNYYNKSGNYRKPGDELFYWFTDSLEYLSKYNQFIEEIVKRINQSEDNLTYVYDEPTYTLIYKGNITDDVDSVVKAQVNREPGPCRGKGCCMARKEGDLIYVYMPCDTINLRSYKYPVSNEFYSVSQDIWKDSLLVCYHEFKEGDSLSLFGSIKLFKDTVYKESTSYFDDLIFSEDAIGTVVKYVNYESVDSLIKEQLGTTISKDTIFEICELLELNSDTICHLEEMAVLRNYIIESNKYYYDSRGKLTRFKAGLNELLDNSKERFSGAGSLVSEWFDEKSKQFKESIK